jgi:hypothetical protein
VLCEVLRKTRALCTKAHAPEDDGPRRKPPAPPSPSMMQLNAANRHETQTRTTDKSPYAASASSSRPNRRARYRRTGPSTPFSERAPADDQR